MLYHDELLYQQCPVALTAHHCKVRTGQCWHPSLPLALAHRLRWTDVCSCHSPTHIVLCGRVACRPQTGELLWELAEDDQQCMALHKGSVYVGNGDGTVVCLNAKTGALRCCALALRSAPRPCPPPPHVERALCKRQRCVSCATRTNTREHTPAAYTR
jgi:hypothetical protein